MKRFHWLMPCSFTAAWLLVLPVACSVNLSDLNAGCALPLVNCHGKCVATACGADAGGGSGGSDTETSGADSGGLADAAGQTNGGGHVETGGAGNLAGANDIGGMGGNPLICTTIPYTFHYTAQPPQFPVATKSVAVSGDWIKWDQVGVPLTAGADGVYTGVVDMPRGKSLYKFVIDSTTWVQDPDNPSSEADPFLGRNSILDLKCGEDYSGDSAGQGGSN